ncbi:MAG: alpha-L-arabinofuranosidase C-terminal domain-containing protein [Nitrososphaerota archaeon]|nr:alpha-N-arabinofuranosidase [Candidatus Bathyarchaeota archaeon]MDW8048250.1 alpha-L-arabinofuranosidase C-terminal domain-containing protein [Nitrososphaerota archaeon]
MVKKGTLKISVDNILGSISPNIFGHFIEHLGRCIYPGIWVGKSSKIPNVDGLRKDVVEKFRAVNPPVIRWPGGCFADQYHWQDGIGPSEKRPRRLNIWWGGEETNEFGTDEFIKFCRYVNAEPYICVNVGSGSPAEAAAWLEYCNYAGKSEYSDLRSKNGSKDPYGVKYWGVGNENWGCGGSFDPVYYAWEYRRFATYLKKIDPSVQLIACGHISRDWNYKFMENLRNHINLIDHLSIHYYFPKFGGDTNFTEEDYFNLMLDVQNLEYQIQQAINVVEYFAEGRKDIGVVVDEWGTWHPQATVETGLYQQNTLRDALLAGAVLNLFTKYCRKVVMANLAQTVNVLQSLFLTRGEQTIVTPTYHVFALYKEHMGNYALKVNYESPVVKELPRIEERHQRFKSERIKPLQALDASASLSKDGGQIILTLLNQSLEDLEVAISLTGGKEVAETRLSVLTADNLQDHNDFHSPDKVSPREEKIKARGHTFDYTAPKHSVSRLILYLS